MDRKVVSIILNAAAPPRLTAPTPVLEPKKHGPRANEQSKRAPYNGLGLACYPPGERENARSDHAIGGDQDRAADIARAGAIATGSALPPGRSRRK